ncbi:MAG: DUF4258 domain-containing protein [Thermoguttaceae bacterium]
MKISQHAEDRMKERNVSLFLLQVALDSPSSIARREDGRTYIKTLPGGNELHVGTCMVMGELLVKTVFVREKK